eukprot:1196722-Pyramimonas_sp.AAC.1
MQRLRAECYPMDEHDCTYLLMQYMQDRTDGEELTETMAEVRRTFEAERIALAMAAREREQALIDHLHNQTAVVKRQAEKEAKHKYRELLVSERQAVAMATNESIDANA